MSETRETVAEVDDLIDDERFVGDEDQLDPPPLEADGPPQNAPDETGMTYRAPEVSSIQLGEHFKITPRGLVTLNNPTFADRATMGATLHVLAEAIQLALGDFVNETEAALGEEASQILDIDDGWAESTRKTYSWVSKRVKPENRLIPPLTFGHLQAVAEMGDTQQRKWLDNAALGDGTTPWSISKLKTELRAAKAGGAKGLSFYVVVNAGSQAMQAKLAKRLEGEGFLVVTREGTKLQRDKVAKSRRRDAGKSRPSTKAEFKSFPKADKPKRGRPRKAR